jgi:hypothetical protein
LSFAAGVDVCLQFEGVVQHKLKVLAHCKHWFVLACRL